jgi:predicted phage terminase large subunit-like protein
VVRFRESANEVEKRIKNTASQDGKACRIRLPQDPGQAGKEQSIALVRMLAGFSVRAIPVSGDKQVRADPFAAQLNGGNVWLLRGAWNASFIEELRQFPGGRHDDAVDAAADAFNDLTGGQSPAMPTYRPPQSEAMGYVGR